MRAVTAVITGVGSSNTLCMTPSMRKRMLLGLAPRLQMDVRGALLERVLQQPVDDVHDMAIVGADFAALAQLDQLLEVEDRRRRVAAGLGVLRQLDRALHARRIPAGSG